MPNWKKLIVSGSDASLNNLTVNNTVSASYFSGDGSALTNISAEVTEQATVSDTFTSVTTKTVTHNFGTKNVLVSVYNNSDQLILPATLTTTDTNTVDVTFDSATSGRIVVAKGGHLVSGSISFNELSNNPFTATGNDITASGNLVPSAHVTYDLGSANLRWRDLYLSGSTIDLGGTKITRDTDGNVEFKDGGGTRKTLKVDELEIGSGAKKVRLRVDNNNRLKFEDADSGDTEAPTFFKTTLSSVTSANITHSLAEDFPIVQLYDNATKKQMIPGDIESINQNVVKLSFDSNFSGTVVIKK